MAAAAWEAGLKYAQRYLEEIGLEAGRLGRSLVTPGAEAELAAVLKEVKARLKTLGPSRLKSQA